VERVARFVNPTSALSRDEPEKWVSIRLSGVRIAALITTLGLHLRSGMYAKHHLVRSIDNPVILQLGRDEIQ